MATRVKKIQETLDENGIRYRKAKKEELEYLIGRCQTEYENDLKAMRPDSFEQSIIAISVIMVMLSIFAAIVSNMFILIFGVFYALIVGIAMHLKDYSTVYPMSKLVGYLKSDNYRLYDCVFVSKGIGNTVKVRFNNGEERVEELFKNEKFDFTEDILRYVDFGNGYKGYLFYIVEESAED